MEDEDGEGSNVDSWTLPEQLMYKDSSYVCDTLNKRTNNVSDYVDGVEENKEDATTDDKLFNSKIIFKGFKKRILAQTQENQIPDRILINNQDGCITSPSKSSKEKSNDFKRGKITEYAQYLGLQPTGKYKCPKCNPIVTFRTMSMLKQHQCVCTSITNVSHGLPSTSEQHSINTTTSASNNFRISRKVYLCAACGTYFENWNLFLHMREIHKRHICLFCLGMFGQAERLSHHLVKKHSVPETQFHTIDEFYSVFKGSCYLICCTCEKVFSETDNFYFHTCVTLNERTFTNSVCSICRQTDGTHSSKCGMKKPECNFERKNINERIQASDSEQTLFPNPANAVAKKLLCANKARLKTSERFLLSSYKRKLLDMYARKLKTQKYNSKNFERDCDARGLSRVDALVDAKSTLAPTGALHTTKYEGDREHNRLLASNNAIKERHIVEIDVTKSPAHERIIDRYTDTIMQVSQCSDELDSSNELKDDEGFEIDHSEGQLTAMDELSMERDDDDDEDYDRINNLDDTPENIEQGELILDDGNDDTPVESPSVTPNHSNFISIQESIMKTQEKLISPSILDEDTSCMISKESPRVTVSRVNSTKRSLVIKICTNKNSQFTVATPNGNGNYESNSHGDNEDDDNEEEDDDEEDDDGESEGNNNVGDAGSEKEISATDSDSGNLAVSLPELSTDKNEIESMTLATTTQSPITAAITTTTAEVSTAPPTTTTTVSSIGATVNAVESAAVELSNESSAIAVEENKIEETPQTKETTIIDTPSIPSEPSQLNKNSETSNVDVNQSNESMVDNSLAIATDNPETITPDEQQQMSTEQMSDGITLAAEEIPSIDLNVSGTLDSIEIEDLLKCCIEAASPTCIYCNHARHIAVNGKQLGLHILAEHRFQPQHPAIIIQRDQFNVRVKKSLDELTTRWFNLDSYDNTRGTYNVSTVKTYECYLCRIYYSVHKELYLHNRKMHQKTILICIMCKSTFYSHSELLCHLCPGVYSSHINIKYRCCLCSIESLPSAFRLMVHLRKRHHACDVCLESTGNQQRLSNHVWKHKLHHLCYRCGIAYRNKPDITKHLFWKHGTESVLCKKCLQKKWPHIYHFCIPPSVFVCEECGSTFSRAVALKVHKRLHSGDTPYNCLECSASFISKKLLNKHNEIHKPLQIENSIVQIQCDSEQNHNTTTLEINKTTIHDEQMEIVSDTSNIAPSIQKEIVKKVMDVYDLPPLNLSSDSDSDTEDDKTSKREENIDNKQENIDDVCKNVDVVTINNEENENIVTTLCKNIDINVENISDNIISTETNDSIRDVDESNEEETKKEEVVIMNGIWDNFKSYTASLESSEINIKADNDNSKNDELLSVITAEHDYCIVYGDNSKEENTGTDNVETENDGGKNVTSPSTPSITANGENDLAKRKTNKSPKKKGNKSLEDGGGGGGGSSTSSDSSSDSDSSSCSCGTNCSCSSSSSGSSTSSSSSSDSDCSTSESSPKKSTANKKDRRKEKDTKKNHAKDSTEVTRADAEIEVQAENGVQSVDDSAVVEPTVNVTEQDVNDKVILPPPPAPLRESDLETDETETDEDFYDEYPQQHANKLLAEKRNQLMLLATVAPPSADDSALGSSSNDMKNGIIDASNDIGNSSPPSQLQVAQIKTNIKRKIKTKRRKKGEGGRGRGRQSNSVQSAATAIVNPSPIVESIKLNIPKILYRNKQPGARRRSSSPNVNTLKSREPKLPAVTYQISQSDYNTNQLTPSRTMNAHNSSNDNESANDNKRSSKRKRVPKRFYGDSSDEEQQRLPNSITQKWRRLDSHTPVNSYVPSITIKQNYGPPSSTIQSTKNYQAVPSVSIVPEISTEQETTPATITTPVSTSEPAPVSSLTESEDPPDGSSSDSSTSDNEQPRHPPRQHPGENNLQGTAIPNRQANLYCYCQCPYDEVSEMIACDGNNCRIEWFHFECVGIMVPPKGKWYCPDCSKRDPTLPNNEYLV